MVAFSKPHVKVKELRFLQFYCLSVAGSSVVTSDSGSGELQLSPSRSHIKEHHSSSENEDSKKLNFQDYPHEYFSESQFHFVPKLKGKE